MAIIAFAAGGALFALLGAVIFRGLALTLLWGWFIQHKFGLPGINIAEAFGIVLTIALLTKEPADPDLQERSYKFRTEEEKREDLVSTAVATLGFPLIGIVLGYLVHQFV